MNSPTVALLDYGSGNLRSAQRAVEAAGANAIVTSDPKVAMEASGLLVPGVGAFAACMDGLHAVQGPRLIGSRLAGGRPVMGICVGMQILFDRGLEFADGIHPDDEEQLVGTRGCGQWPGTVNQLQADILPHMGWNTVEAPEDSQMFAGLHDQHFYFVHSYAVHSSELDEDAFIPPKITWTEYGGDRFISAMENGPLWATQFHPEKSGDAGLRLLKNWINTL